jgi:hypothetical protein
MSVCEYTHALADTNMPTFTTYYTYIPSSLSFEVLSAPKHKKQDRVTLTLFYTKIYWQALCFFS